MWIGDWRTDFAQGQSLCLKRAMGKVRAPVPFHAEGPIFKGILPHRIHFLLMNVPFVPVTVSTT
jgi:hypothetical protein